MVLFISFYFRTMAGISAAGVLEKISQGHLECPICFSRFTNPKILNCLHSFCQRCLEKMMEGHSQQREITCPVCRQQMVLSEAGIAGIANNFSLMALVDEVTQQEELVKSQRSKIICEVCDEQVEAIVRCLECREYLCEACHSAHSRNKKTKNHETASIDDLHSGKVPYQSRLWNEVPKCPKHPSQDLYFFCETCTTLICAACTALDHKAPDHKFSDISKATALCKEKLDGLEREAEQHLANLRDANATAANSYTNHKVLTTEIQSAISTKADEEVAKIRKVERLLKNNLTQLFHNKDKEIEGKMVKYRERVEKMETTMESVRTVRSQANDYDLLRHQENILQNIQLATKTGTPDPVQGLTHEDIQQCKNFTDSNLEEPPSTKSTDLKKYSDLIMDTGEVIVSHPGKCTACGQNLDTKAFTNDMT
ncbi:E3 ubiquitin-protein ligase TRIM56-like [Patiria miniata]|uniref:Uncharacterized protein n=1 Tax=Patiria miniata TaxID=46514 RepID=A0A913ZWK2_PATMI|nr:E3 ubiquitin-protein ligase TRIM56-like [Patiria miniata]